MVTQAPQRSLKHRAGEWHLCPRVLLVLMLGVAASMPCSVAMADEFAGVQYDAQTDELVVTMSYSGTNPDHEFSLQWGECQTLPDSSVPEIVADVIDSQSQDAARKDFSTTTRFSLEDLPCRPVKVTLRTAPRFYYTLQIPARTAPRQ
jgi:hypothetical protein